MELQRIADQPTPTEPPPPALVVVLSLTQAEVDRTARELWALPDDLVRVSPMLDYLRERFAPYATPTPEPLDKRREDGALDPYRQLFASAHEWRRCPCAACSQKRMAFVALTDPET